MKKLWYCFTKDVKLSMKGMYFYIEIAVAVVFVVVLLLAVPKDPIRTIKVYASINIENMNKEDLIKKLESKGMSLILLDSKKDVIASLEDSRSIIGLSIQTKDGEPAFEYILQGYESEKYRNILETSVRTGFGENTTAQIKVSTLGTNLERLSNRINLLPVFLAMNVALMGFFIIASYIFLDKEEGTIKALAVTPASVWQYLLSKVLLILLTGVISSFITVIAIAGSNANYLQLTLAIIAYNIFGSTLGLFIASFFNTMSKAMGTLYLGLILLAIVSVSYFSPAFSPLIIRIMPTYPMVFSLREIFLSDGNSTYVYNSIIGFSLAGVALFFLANYRYKKTITV